MHDPLYNPVYNALVSGDAHLSSGTEQVKYFHEQVSPFAGFHESCTNGFTELYDMLPTGRHIGFASPVAIDTPTGWQELAAINGLQFIHTKEMHLDKPAIQPLPLDTSHAHEMVALAALTKPGPFDLRTIEFGHYHGIFDNDKLVAMTGQRLHIYDHTEISAVCTHPDHVGKGYAAALMIHQMSIIKSQGKQAILHVRADNSRAIALYERLGFTVNREMNFYFMERQ